MPGFPTPDALRTDALTGRIDRRAFAAFRRRLTGRTRIGTTVRFVVLPTIGVVALVIGGLALVGGIAEELASDRPDRRSESVAMAAILAFMVFCVVLFLVFAIRARRQRLRPRAHFRLEGFARDNGLRYTPGPVPSPMLRSIGGRGIASVRSVVSGRDVEVRNLELSDRAKRETRFAGYCALRLPRALPNLVLLADGARSHPLTDAAPPAADQRLRLEGDFDRSFRLYCPAGYERDALYLITPDVMARLIDEAGGWDVEVVDDLLILSRSRDAVGLDPERWRRLVATIDALDDKVARWARWRETRVGGMPAITGASLTTEAPVAAEGRRVRSGSLRFILAIVLPLAAMVALAMTRLLDG